MSRREPNDSTFKLLRQHTRVRVNEHAKGYRHEKPAL
jgi:hypothetical protein